jgi:hypothetical protein
MSDKLKFYVDQKKCGTATADEIATVMQGRFQDVRFAVGPESLNKRELAPECKARFVQVNDYFQHLCSKDKAEK